MIVLRVKSCRQPAARRKQSYIVQEVKKVNRKIKKLLTNQGGNYIFPFFWQHGEEEAVLREYMKVIDESNIKAVCVESRPHPDFCGPKWWADMDVILDEARKRGMKVWILDDSHFPTGYANGAMAEQPDELCRQSVSCRTYRCSGGETLCIGKEELFHPDPFQPTQIESYIGEKEPRHFDDDRLLRLFVVPFAAQVESGRESAKSLAEKSIDLSGHITENGISWKVPEGIWKVYALHISRNLGYHRSYINMMDSASCRVLIDAVYEPHYAHYGEEFGKTIAGFFSDEPELGNGHLYATDVVFGKDMDFPWSAPLEDALKEALGVDYGIKLALLWEEDADPEEKARIRYAYMDAVTRLVKKSFSEQLGSWCREHGAEYIGHLIEDNNMHARTGSSLGHYFRGLSGQDMSGIDDIGGQVLPQGEDLNYDDGVFSKRIGEFYHYMLGKLGSSSAAIEPLKKGNSMCEIFGAYGWSEGVRLEKYLVDHFLVRGINHYVPHAFSPMAFPDPDCPPHFYAHGNNPQYRHFGCLMAYTNRVCELIAHGRHVAEIAVLYHGEGEWTGKCMYSHKPAHLLADAQMDYDLIPQDVFADRDGFKTVLEKGVLRVNTQEYRVLIVPYMEYVTQAFARAAGELERMGIPVFFMEGYPAGLCDCADKEEEKKLLAGMHGCRLVETDKLIPALKELDFADISIQPADDRLRYYHYEQEDGSAVYLFVNEGTEGYRGRITIGDPRRCYLYHAWENCLERADYDGSVLTVEVEPLKSLIAVFDKEGLTQEEADAWICRPVKADGEKLAFAGEWERSICRSIDYPDFKDGRKITLPDRLAEEKPEFSGFVRYENEFILSKGQMAEGGRIVLVVTDAWEGVELFVNKSSAGIQIAPPFLYDITGLCREGENEVMIEVATTLEREMAKVPDPIRPKPEPATLSGITGEVCLFSC